MDAEEKKLLEEKLLRVQTIGIDLKKNLAKSKGSTKIIGNKKQSIHVFQQGLFDHL